MTTVRIRRKDDRYDGANAVKITPRQHVMIEVEFGDDYKRLDAFEQERDRVDLEASSTTAEATQCPPEPTNARPTSSSSRDSRLSDQSDCMTHHARNTDGLVEGDATPGRLDSESPRDDEMKSDLVVEALFTVDVFNMAHDDSAEAVLLVDLWFELTEHLSADTIPNPLDFYKEREAVIRYVEILVFTMRPD